MDNSSEKIIKALVSRVNATLGYYEKSYISAKRSPDIERTRCESFEEFIEIRFNYEAYRVPELRELIEATGGKLFTCTQIIDPDTVKRRFTTAYVQIIDPKTLPEEDESLKNEILRVQEWLGGSIIGFNSVRKKIKIEIRDE